MTWIEKIEAAKLRRNDTAGECMAMIQALAAERDELQAQVAVLRGALETATDYLYNPFEPDNQCAQYKNIKNILQTTPAEAAEGVQMLVEALEGICAEFNDTETDICTTIQAMHDKAQDALSEWRRDK